MVLTNPQDVRMKFATAKEWLTVDEIAKNLGAGYKTIQKALAGEPVRAVTVKKIAKALGVPAMEIATFVD